MEDLEHLQRVADEIQVFDKAVIYYVAYYKVDKRKQDIALFYHTGTRMIDRLLNDVSRNITTYYDRICKLFRAYKATR